MYNSTLDLHIEQPPVADDAWKADALCAQVGGNAWFPEQGEPTRDAKRVCARCTVRAECLEYALTEDIRHGVWGGLAERERMRLRRAAV